MKLRIKTHRESSPVYGVYTRSYTIEKRVRLFPSANWETLYHFDTLIWFRSKKDAQRFIDIYNALKRRGRI